MVKIMVVKSKAMRRSKAGRQQPPKSVNPLKESRTLQVRTKITLFLVRSINRIFTVCWVQKVESHHALLGSSAGGFVCHWPYLDFVM